MLRFGDLFADGLRSSESKVMRCSILVLFCMMVLPAATFGKDRLPGGGIAEAKGNGPVRAWYEQPTRRYDHGVLGDAIEAGSLVVIDAAGQRYELVLPKAFVFEDITPRIADLDGDGENEVITIRTKLDAGAAVAVYNIKEGKLIERASTAPIGSTHRWLSIAGIGDFLGKGHREIAIVKTPHIGGVLELLSMRASRLVSLYPPQAGYSTHFIGAKFVSLAAVDITGEDRASTLVLPNQARDKIFVLDLRKGTDVVSSHPLPARITHPVRLLRQGRIEVRLENGETLPINIWPTPGSVDTGLN